MQLVFLPGLGADARQWAPQRAAFPSLIVPDWIAPHPREPLAEYAARLAMPADVLIGSSFGGMIALEMARIINPRLVLLVGSATSVPKLARWLAPLGGVSRMMPNALMLAAFGPHANGSRAVAAAMLRDADPAFVSWGASAMAGWRPAPFTFPVKRIHGDRDRLIPVGDADQVVAGAGHLVNLTHPDEVNRFIERALPAPMNEARRLQRRR